MRRTDRQDVIPAQAGIQPRGYDWTPAFAGVTRHRPSPSRLPFLLFLVLLLPWLAVAGPDSGSEVERLRFVGNPGYGRLVVELSAPTEHELLELPADAEAGKPARVVLDLAGARFGPNGTGPLTIEDALVRRIRTGQFTVDTARIVVDLARTSRPRVFVLKDPYRIIVDLRSLGTVGATGDVVRVDSGAKGTPPARGAQESLTVAARSQPEGTGRTRARDSEGDRQRRFTVMIDPGHGGKDPGAHGIGGLREKDVVLSVSRLIADRLRTDPSIDVHLTREDDRFLSLEERTGLANAVGADLFISVHANASPRRAAKGVEVYYLNNTDNRGTLRLAAMENGLKWNPEDRSLPDQIPDLSYILSDLRQTYKVEESRRLAEILGTSTVSHLTRHYDDMQNLGPKKGPFYVLVGAHMPCVLVEVGFLTNPVEGRRLASMAYRRQVADGIVRGIRHYLTEARVAGTL